MGLLRDEMQANRRLYVLRQKGADLGAKMAALLATTLQGVDADQKESKQATQLISAATAFTYPRRVALLRFLHAGNKGSIAALASELEVPQPSILRHLSKLEKRGFLKWEQKAGSRMYQIATPKSRSHKEFAKVIYSHWGAQSPTVQ
ncbi:MAG: DNA-binding MarR family transcriptional regulator [Rhodothermales bacterium]|jgi:DNA-binding MarR family transcriptional regulator